MMVIVAHSPSLSRTTSASSIASDDTLVACETTDIPQKEPALCLEGAVSFVFDEPLTSDDIVLAPGKVPRTRRRFSNEQLIMLEHLFHDNTHPTREQRDRVASEGNMESRSVTIWFQNKRQSERRARTRRSSSRRTKSSPTPSSSSASSRITLAAFRKSRSDNARFLFPITLDDVAARVERHLPNPSTPRRKVLSLPTLPANPIEATQRATVAIYDSMLSSPPSSCRSCKERELKVDLAQVDLGRDGAKTRRTLEWACAVARVDRRVSGERGLLEEDLVLDLGGDTDTEDVHEAVTPKSAKSSRGGPATSQESKEENKENVPAAEATQGERVKFPTKEDNAEERRDDEMDVALVLAGLGNA